MAWTNLDNSDMSPHKRALGIVIDEGEIAPSKKVNKNLPK